MTRSSPPPSPTLPPIFQAPAKTRSIVTTERRERAKGRERKEVRREIGEGRNEPRRIPVSRQLRGDIAWVLMVVGRKEEDYNRAERRRTGPRSSPWE